MKTYTRIYLRKAFMLSAITGLGLSLSGCIVALPPAVQLASLALDGVSYMATGKSVTDHAISTVTAKDCAMLRGLQGDNICTANVVEVATLPDGTIVAPALIAADAGRDIKTAKQDVTFQAFSANQTAQHAANQAYGDGVDLDEILSISKEESDRIDMQTAAGPML